MSALIGIGGIIFAFYYTMTAPATGFRGYIDIPSMVLLGIGPPAVMLLSRTLGDLGLGLQTLFESLFINKRRIQNDVITALSRLSARVRAEGFGALVAERKTLRYDFLRDGVSMIVNDFSLEEIKHNLNSKLQAKQSRMSGASDLFTNMSKLCPGVGMLGTLMGLIQMMSALKDPASIGSGMAFAMITTLYGLMLGTFIYAPWGEKISVESEKTLEIDLLVLEGVLHLKSKKSSLHFNNLLNTYSSKKIAPMQQPKKGA